MTMREVCKRQLARLPANLPNGPESDADRKSYLNAFEKHARSELHATRVIDSLIETCQFYPKIAEIVQACAYIDPHEGAALPPGCSECGDAPWVTRERGGVSYAARCTCERGRYLAARDTERRRAA